MSDDIFTLHRGTRPLLLSLPHVGSALPDWLAPRLVPRALQVEDTDWHLDRLYGFAKALGVSVLVPRHSRYVVDLNRPSENTPMYPGVNNTALCPTTFFTGDALYRPGEEPNDAEVAQRVDRYWRPYHAALRAELDRLHAEHGRVVLWEAHSIRGVLPFLFDGRLPDLNLGTAGGSSCTPQLQRSLEALLSTQTRYDVAVNGRFKGGYITRHYGEPSRGIDAVQLEISQRNYMDEDSFQYAPQRAEELQVLLAALLARAVAAPGGDA